MSTADAAQTADTGTTAEMVLPLLGLRISAGPVELRGITDDLLGPLADLVIEGIDSPGRPSFLTPWKTEPRQDLPRLVAQHYWQLRAEFSPEQWTAQLAGGIGTAMRQVIAAFAFDHLEARHLTSEAFADNAASVSVSRKAGYAENGIDVWARDGVPVPHQRFLLTPSTLVRYPHPLQVTGLAAFRRSIGLKVRRR